MIREWLQYRNEYKGFCCVMIPMKQIQPSSYHLDIFRPWFFAINAIIFCFLVYHPIIQTTPHTSLQKLNDDLSGIQSAWSRSL